MVSGVSLEPGSSNLQGQCQGPTVMLGNKTDIIVNVPSKGLGCIYIFALTATKDQADMDR